ncbi:MAG TPA: hypothetical protein VIX59_09115 [Candidatus Binataceae bacterium]
MRLRGCAIAIAIAAALMLTPSSATSASTATTKAPRSVSAASRPDASASNAAPLPENALQRPPVGADGQPLDVAIGMHLVNMASIDEVTEQFQIDGFLIARWKDPRLAYQPQDKDDVVRYYEPNAFWIPRLEIVNAAAPRDNYDVSIRVAPDGTVRYLERFRAILSSKFELQRFPFDTQTLRVIIHPFVSNTRTLKLSLEDQHTWVSSEFNSYSSLAQWELGAVSPRIGTYRLFGNTDISEIEFDIVVQRRYRFYLWKVMLPLLLMVMLSWAVFWVEPRDLSSQVQIAVTTILTVIAFAFAISATMPRVPYLTYIDGFFLECYVFVFISSLEVMTVHVSHRSERLADRGIRIRRISRWFIPAAFLVTNLILIRVFLFS